MGMKMFRRFLSLTGTLLIVAVIVLCSMLVLPECWIIICTMC